MQWIGGRKRRLAALIAVVLIAVVETFVFIVPPTDTATRADAIVIFDGPGERIDYAWELAERDHLAPTVVVSIDDTGKCEPWERELEEYCLTPDPATTRGESRAFGDLARDRGWGHVIAVSTASQSVRARVRLGRCFDGEVDYVTVREASLLDQAYRVIYENGAMIKALLFEREC